MTSRATLCETCSERRQKATCERVKLFASGKEDHAWTGALFVTTTCIIRPRDLLGSCPNQRVDIVWKCELGRLPCQHHRECDRDTGQLPEIARGLNNCERLHFARH